MTINFQFSIFKLMAHKPQQKEIVRPKIRKGDTVRILSGKDRGKSGSVMAVLPRNGRVLVEGINMMMKHIRPKRAGEKGQRVSIAAPLHISNVQILCPSCKKSSRIGITREDSKRQRVCKKCKTVID